MRVPPMRAVPRLPTHTLVSASAAAAAILSSCILSVAPGPSLAAELGALGGGRHAQVKLLEQPPGKQRVPRLPQRDAQAAARRLLVVADDVGPRPVVGLPLALERRDAQRVDHERARVRAAPPRVLCHVAHEPRQRVAALGREAARAAAATERAAARAAAEEEPPTL